MMQTRERADSVAAGLPRRHLGVGHATVLALGMVLTTDTLRTAPTVALSLGTWRFYETWVLGGLFSMAGALCYAEMASAFPHPGGDYHFLRKAYGREVGFLFAWSRFAVMHTGWIALMAFMFADYAAAVLPIGHAGRTVFALAVVTAMAGLNLLHVRRGFAAQAGLVGLVALGFAGVVAAAVKLAAEGRVPIAPEAAHAAPPGAGRLAVALIYIFLAYGGWSDAATLSAEVRGGRRAMLAAIMGSLAALIAIYLALNAAMLIGLGPAGLARSSAPAAELMGRAFGPAGAGLIVAVVGVSAVASINSTLIVGARTTFAAARETPGLAALGVWREDRGIPARAVLAEAAVALLLVLGGGFAKSGFDAMVAYMTPVYWLFMTLSMGAAVILRRRPPEAERPFRAPLHPLFPLLFMAISLYMLWAGAAQLGRGALVGAGVLAAGAGVLALTRLPLARGFRASGGRTD